MGNLKSIALMSKKREYNIIIKFIEDYVNIINIINHLINVLFHPIFGYE